MQKSRNVSLIESVMRDNSIFALWTQTWGLIVRPCYQIDRLKFSFIEKGAEGKGKSFDIYVEALKFGAACFDNWAYDVLHGRFERILAAEKTAGEKYPKAYKYVTGENAEKSVGIMNSTNGGYCINAMVPGEDGKKVYANVPVSFHDLRLLAQNYVKSYESRRDELEKIRLAAEAEIEKNRKAAKGISEQTAPTAPVEEPKPQAATPAPQATEKPAQKPEKKPVVSEEFKVNGKLTEGSDGSYEIEAITKEGDPVIVRFVDKQIKATDPKLWEAFRQKFSKGNGKHFVINGAYGKENKFYFQSF